MCKLSALYLLRLLSYACRNNNNNNNNNKWVMKNELLINPRRACARVTVVVLCVCICPSVTALAATVSVYTCDQRHPRVSLDFKCVEFQQNLQFKSYGVKKPVCKCFGASRFRALSGLSKRRNCLKDDW